MSPLHSATSSSSQVLFFSWERKIGVKLAGRWPSLLPRSLVSLISPRTYGRPWPGIRDGSPATLPLCPPLPLTSRALGRGRVMWRDGVTLAFEAGKPYSSEGGPPSLAFSSRQRHAGAMGVKGTNLGRHQNPQHLLLAFPALPHRGRRSGSHRLRDTMLPSSQPGHVYPEDSEAQTYRSFRIGKATPRCYCWEWRSHWAS